MGRKTVTCIISTAFIMALALSACKKTEETTNVNPAPVAVPGPAGAPGAPGAPGATGFAGRSGATGTPGNTGAPGERGKTGGDTIVVVPAPSPGK